MRLNNIAGHSAENKNGKPVISAECAPLGGDGFDIKFYFIVLFKTQYKPPLYIIAYIIKNIKRNCANLK